jgi:hypothetical protein
LTFNQLITTGESEPPGHYPARTGWWESGQLDRKILRTGGNKLKFDIGDMPPASSKIGGKGPL